VLWRDNPGSAQTYLEVFPVTLCETPVSSVVKTLVLTTEDTKEVSQRFTKWTAAAEE
jgi:hypothetical protein